MEDEGSSADNRTKLQQQENSPVKSFKSSASLRKIHSRKLVSKPSLRDAFKASQRSLFSSSSFAVKGPSEAERMTMKGPRYQPTYRLDSKRPFSPKEVYRVLAHIVEREMGDQSKYDPAYAPKMIQSIAGEARNSVKALNYDRYKICVFVYLGQKKLHGFQAAFRCLWDCQRDGWATYFCQTRTYFISCTCYGLYHD